jgi:hypothetical protein
MLQYMGHTSRVLGESKKSDHKGIVTVVGSKMNMARTSASVPIFLCLNIKGIDPLAS